MKRSEIIANVVKDLDGLHSPNTVNSILFLLECYGMKPPSMSLPTKAILNGKEINVGNITSVNIWEPEDEKK